MVACVTLNPQHGKVFPSWEKTMMVVNYSVRQSCTNDLKVLSGDKDLIYRVMIDWCNIRKCQIAQK